MKPVPLFCSLVMGIHCLYGDPTTATLIRREADEAKLEARRVAIRERIQRQHEIASRMAAEKAAAEEKARQEMSRFRGKPLFEKLMEEYEQQRLMEVRPLLW